MTVFLPLEAASSSASTSALAFPPTPTFLVPSPQPQEHVKKVIKAIVKARRIAVVCGAGISVQAGIPDFRSSEGLFQSLKRDNPTLSSGKDLFDASVFNSEETTSLFCQMIARLSDLTQSAAPTTFHKMLRSLDERHKLLRVYTQNIDALEMKSGLTFGVPEIDAKRVKPRSHKGKVEVPPDESTVPSDEHSQSQPSPPASRLPSPPIETPRCIPLHGTLETMHCQICTHTFPLRDHLEALASGRPPYCPECASLEETRQLVGKRSRTVGKLRPSVVLYNEVHKDGEEVGEAVRKDLVKGKGRAGADLLLVVGTSLRVPGTKRIVREFSKAVRHSSSQAAAANSAGESSGSASTTGLATPAPSPRRTPVGDEDLPVKTVYLNFDFPVPTREWEGVFDVWIRGDAQEFARMVEEEMEKQAQAKEAAIERKKKRMEAAMLAALEKQQQENQPGEKKEKSKKRQSNSESGSPPEKIVKKRKASPYLTPESTAKVKPSKRKGTTQNDVLPAFKRPKKSKTQDTGPPQQQQQQQKLYIKIPRRSIPEVVITRTKEHMKCIKHHHQKASTPISTPPSSPLTPVPSSPPHRRKTSVSKPKERCDPDYGFPFSPRAERLDIDLDFNPLILDNFDGQVNYWDSEDASSELTDIEVSGHGRLPESYERSTLNYGVHDTGG